MTARFFDDTNIVVYALDADVTKRQCALAVLGRRPVISVQVVNEFLYVLLGKQRLDRVKANRLAQILLRRCDVVPLTAAMVAQAMQLGVRYQLIDPAR